jgi:glycosyltransferase involved in cell wall biosynthesis
MAMGIPVVSFDLRESRVSADEAAVYARDNDEEQFASLISELLDDPERRRRMGEIGRDRVTGPLSWKQSEQALVAAYDLAHRPTPRPRKR